MDCGDTLPLSTGAIPLRRDVEPKRGHVRALQTQRQATDIFFDGKTDLFLSAPFIRGVQTHGTGCTCSAAITGYLARGYGLAEAVKRAKQFITGAIAHSYRIGKHFALDPNFSARPR